MAFSGKLLASILLVSIASYCQATVENAHGEVSETCDGSRATCVARTMTRYHCSSTWHAIQMDMIRSDTNNDCMVDGGDLAKNYRDNYNLQDEDEICEREWLHRTTNYLGLSSGFTSYLYRKRHGEECADIDDLEDEEEGMKLKPDYVNNAVQSLVEFCSQATNMRDNRDCWDLVSICKEVAPSLPACANAKLNRYKTLSDKLMKFNELMDKDRDSFVSTGDLDNVFRSSTYDVDENTCLSPQEFSSWGSDFHLSMRLTDKIYKSHVKNTRPNCLRASDFKIGQREQGHTLLLKIIINECQKQSSFYRDIPECAVLMHTCQHQFQNNIHCREHFGTCGLHGYLNCVERLSGSACSTEADEYEMKFEKLKIYNQLNETCTVELMNASGKLTLGVLMTFLPLALTLLAWL